VALHRDDPRAAGDEAILVNGSVLELERGLRPAGREFPECGRLPDERVGKAIFEDHGYTVTARARRNSPWIGQTWTDFDRRNKV
jgi:hypothetical protein